MSEGDTNDGFTASEVQQVAGLSYRQLNDWESRGALPQQLDRGSKWRRFTPRQVFSVLVCAEIRKQFGTPVERLGWLQEFMLQDGANHLAASVELMAKLGVNVWLVTDLEKTFILDSELEFVDLVTHGFLSGESNAGYIWLRVNPLVNRILSTLKEPIRLDNHGRGYEILREMRSMFGVNSPDEYRVLQHIRSGDFESVEIVMKNGKVRTIRTTKNHKSTESINELLRSKDYQKLTLVTKAGEVVSIQQQATEKVDDDAFR